MQDREKGVLMNYKYEYKNNDDREELMNKYNTLFLIEEQNIVEGNFLIFSDTQRQSENIESEDLNNRVSDISSYLVDSDEATISSVENIILEVEKNKIINGGM